MAVVANNFDIAPAIAQQPGWTIGNPVKGDIVGRAANISCTGRAPAVGLTFVVKIFDPVTGALEQSVSGTTGGMPMPGNATWQGTLVPPPGQSNLWIPDHFDPPPISIWTTLSPWWLLDVDGTPLKTSYVYVN